MIRMQLSTAAGAIGARLSGQDNWFEGVSTDTRTIASGELFCALRGPLFDGHAHCLEAEQKGACGVLVEQTVETALPSLTVDDSKRALGRLAGAWRERFSIPVVGVTGSNGKTTVKEMLAAILRVNAVVLATKGNLNNDIGVPQTLFRLNAEHEYAVIEMGANHVGEIAWLAEIARPLVGLVTLCAPVHLEGFGSLEHIAQAKGELYAGLRDGGTAVINADDAFADYWSGIARPRRVVRFGLQKPADVSAENVTHKGIGQGMRFRLHLPTTSFDIDLAFDGLHNVANALAAAAAALALDVAPEAIKAGLEHAGKVGGRLCVVEGLRGSRIIDDSYNANPTSLAAAVDVLVSASGQRWVALGDMAELGPQAMDIHRETGLALRDAGVDRLYTFGALAAAAAEAFGAAAESYTEIEDMIEALESVLAPDVTVLVKGSRAMRMERLIDALTGVKQAC